MSFAIYFKFLRRPDKIVHVATRHGEWISRIYQQFDVSVELRDDGNAKGTGMIGVESESAVQTATIRVQRIGADTAAAVEQSCRELLKSSEAKAISLELPLTQRGAAAVCTAAEEMGFFFSGLGPRYVDNNDVLLLQMPREEIDVSLVQIHHPFAREMLEYMDRERERVRQNHGLRG
jgi:hypothetical protein